MTEVINLREIILGILMEVMEEEEQSHQVLRRVLEKYQFLDKRDPGFYFQSVGGHSGKSDFN